MRGDSLRVLDKCESVNGKFMFNNYKFSKTFIACPEI